MAQQCHYVPKAYLREFSDDASRPQLTAFDKLEKRFFRANVHKLAKEGAYYSADIESRLNDEVEVPAQTALDHLRDGRPLSPEDRANFSVYAATMLKRVPRSREKTRELLPEAAKSVTEEIRAQLRSEVRGSTALAAGAARRLEQMDGIEDWLIANPTDDMLNFADNPFPTMKMAQLVFDMRWRVAESNGPQFFLTSDNPAFIFEGYGLGSEESEFMMTLSKRVVLLASWQAGPSLEYRGVGNQGLVREVNRRLVAQATRYVYMSQREYWVEKVALKARPYLSRIRWPT